MKEAFLLYLKMQALSNRSESMRCDFCSREVNVLTKVTFEGENHYLCDYCLKEFRLAKKMAKDYIDQINEITQYLVEQGVLKVQLTEVN